MKQVLSILVLLGTALAGCGSSPPAECAEPPCGDPTGRPPVAADRGAISGLVIDDRYRPVAGALILLTPLGLTATADAQGQFSFLDLQPGAYQLKAQAADHEAAPKPVDVVAGQYTEVELEARRIFNEAGRIITVQYSVFVPCAASVPAGSVTFDCTGDQSGDSFRAAFYTDYTDWGANVTYLITEMKANHKAGSAEGAFKVVVRNADNTDEYYANKFTTDSDYLKITMQFNATSADDNQATPRNIVWDNEHRLENAFFPQGQFKAESQAAMDAGCTPLYDAGLVADCESRGAGAQAGVKVKFVQSLFIGEPEVDIASYATLA